MHFTSFTKETASSWCTQKDYKSIMIREHKNPINSSKLVTPETKKEKKQFKTLNLILCLGVSSPSTQLLLSLSTRNKVCKGEPTISESFFCRASCPCHKKILVVFEIIQPSILNLTKLFRLSKMSQHRCKYQDFGRF